MTEARQPIVTTETVTETEAIPFSKTTREDGSLARGTSRITVAGVDGVRTKTYDITKTDGKETGRKLVKEEVTTQPVAEVTSIGTYVAPAPAPAPRSGDCDPNYAGACVPIASDVDCGGGSGNGPAYLYGTATVVGRDVYGLDRDGDGLACE